MNVALDKINGRRGASTVVNDYGFPDQPMLDEMVDKALEVLSTDHDGFVLMAEGASIDKQAHNMDTERWILDNIEFDRAIEVARKFVARNPGTLLLVTADHECSGAAIIGGSVVSNSDLVAQVQTGQGAAQVRNGVVGTYEAAGFPAYQISADGYPVTTDVDRRMLIGYGANADRYEDWLTNAQPLRDSQQPFNKVPPLSTYPAGPLARDTAGNFLVTGQMPLPLAPPRTSRCPRMGGVLDCSPASSTIRRSRSSSVSSCSSVSPSVIDGTTTRTWPGSSNNGRGGPASGRPPPFVPMPLALAMVSFTGATRRH